MSLTTQVPRLPSLAATVRAHDLFAKKSLGQNFIFDEHILSQIVSHAGDLSTGTTIEIGSGPGGLTRAILAAGTPHLIAIEKDERCFKLLQELQTFYPDSFTLINGDALETAAHTLGTPPRRIIANLPYNISTVLLIKWLAHIKDFTSLTLMFQKEVAERICATVGTSAYGRLAVMTSAYAKAEIKMLLPPEVFTPAPKVSSCLVHITPLPQEQQPTISFASLERVVAIAFNQRRKMLRSSLKPLGDLAKICEYTGIDASKRAENLSVFDFLKLAEYTEKSKA